MLDYMLDDLLDMIDELRAHYGNIVDFDHVDETTKTFFVCRTHDFDPDELYEMREYLEEENSVYRIGSILRQSL